MIDYDNGPSAPPRADPKEYREWWDEDGEKAPGIQVGNFVTPERPRVGVLRGEDIDKALAGRPFQGGAIGRSARPPQEPVETFSLSMCMEEAGELEAVVGALCHTLMAMQDMLQGPVPHIPFHSGPHIESENTGRVELLVMSLRRAHAMAQHGRGLLNEIREGALG